MNAATPASSCSFWRQWLLASIPLLCCLAAFRLIGGDDAAVYESMRAHRNAHYLLKQAMFLLTDHGPQVLYLVYAAILATGLIRRDASLVRLPLAYLAIQLLVGVVLVHSLKMAIGAPRPDNDGLFMPFTLDPRHHSFPSGHTVDVALSCLPLAMRSQRLRTALAWGLVLAVVPFTRVYLGWHHPADVFFGWLLASWGAFAIVTLAARPGLERLLPKRIRPA